jgi:hypothetical protein
MFWFREGKVLDEPREGYHHLRGSSNLAIFLRRKRFSAEVKKLIRRSALLLLFEDRALRA